MAMSKLWDDRERVDRLGIAEPASRA